MNDGLKHWTRINDVNVVCFVAVVCMLLVGAKALLDTPGKKLKPETNKSAFYADMNIMYEDSKVVLKFEDGGNVGWIFKQVK